MKCEKCLKERSRGDLYTFHYESKAGSRAEQVDGRIAGQAGAWICDRCVRMAQARRVALVAMLPLLAFLAAYQVPGAQAVCAGAGILLLLALPALTFSAKREFGEGLAMRARKRDLKAQEYNAAMLAGTYKR